MLKRIIFIILISILILPTTVIAQSSSEKSDSVLIMLDISKRSPRAWRQAKSYLKNLLRSKQMKGIDVGLYVYPLGCKRPVPRPKCQSGLMIVEPGAISAEELADYLDYLHPRGRGAPLGKALKRVKSTSYETIPHLVVAVTKGKDTCGRKPKRFLRKLAKKTKVAVVKLSTQRNTRFFRVARRMRGVQVVDNNPSSLASLLPEKKYPIVRVVERQPTKKTYRPEPIIRTTPVEKKPFIPDTRITEVRKPAEPEKGFPYQWLTLGASVVLAGAGAWVGLSAQNDYDSFQTKPMTDPDYEDEKSSIESRALTADILFSTAIISAGISAVLFYFDSKDK